MDSFQVINELLVPTLCVGMPCQTLRVDLHERNAERCRMHSHAERGNEKARSYRVQSNHPWR